ncbi:MAG TPA: MFS transporter [Dehalococcoidia bacterium]|nr:MFS transporter [Dehalococcoidia bacterium]
MADKAPGGGPSTPAAGAGIAAAAFQFVLLVGVADLLADATYEGGRSIVGPFLGALGASAVAISVLSGLGEMVGHVLRLASGYLSDRAARPWTIALWGYAINMLSVPALALVGHWQLGAALMVAERAGRGIRAPARDLMLSHAASRVGFGWAFGLHEALDQIGAVAGPLVVSLVVYLSEGYRPAFALLLAPALACLAVMSLARLRYPHTAELEAPQSIAPSAALPRRFWLYLLGSALVAAGYADFPLLAFHLQRQGEVAASWLPVLYALAMGMDALAALALGRLFDRLGLRAVALAALVSAPAVPLFLASGGLPLLATGAALWGTGIAAQESVMRAAVAALVPTARRGSAFGLFNSAYGVAWFAGSALLGVLYGLSLPALGALCATAQALAAVVFLAVWRGTTPRPATA